MAASFTSTSASTFTGAPTVKRVQVRPPVRQRQNRNRNLLAIERGNRQADALNRHRPLVHHPLPHVLGHAHLQRPVGCLRGRSRARSQESKVRGNGVHPVPSTCPCTMCPPSGLPAAVGSSRFTLAPGFKRAQRSAVQRLLRQVGVEIRRDPHPAPSDTRPDTPSESPSRSRPATPGASTRDPPHAAAARQADQRSRLLDDSCKHDSILSKSAKSASQRLGWPVQCIRTGA